MFKPGQDVLVDYQGEECAGEVVEVNHGWVLARILLDPVTDWGEFSAAIGPCPLVMVRLTDVRLPDE